MFKRLGEDGEAVLLSSRAIVSSKHPPVKQFFTLIQGALARSPKRLSYGDIFAILRQISLK